MPRSKLYRNLKPGDKIRIRMVSGTPREAVVTVSRVQEVRSGHFTGKRRWAVHGNYPWWWNGPITAYSDERTDLVD